MAVEFQSTLPARGATRPRRCLRSRRGRFNPRSPRGERPHGRRSTRRAIGFNPRSPRGERRPLPSPAPLNPLGFNPRSPRGERPGMGTSVIAPARFQSTLPARGATEGPPASLAPGTRFNPRSPRGERRRAAGLARTWHAFQSTLPARGATRRSRPGRQASAVSIHAPRAGSDFSGCSMGLTSFRFNPRSPRGERPA